MPLDATTRLFVTQPSKILAKFLEKMPYLVSTTALAGILAILGTCGGSILAVETSYAIKRTPPGGAWSVTTELAATGTLKNSASSQGTRTLPITITGELHFTEIAGAAARAPEGVAACVRHYSSTKATVEVDGQTDQMQLSANRRLICVRKMSQGVIYFSPEGPVTRDDLELIETQFDPMTLLDMLPAELVTPGKTWRPPADAVAEVLGLETVSRTTLQCTLNRPEGSRLKIDVAGEADGTNLGAKSMIKVQGHMIYDKSESRITEVDVRIQEQRDISRAAPGFEMTASVKTKVSRLSKTPAELSAAQLAHFKLEPSAATLCLDFAAPAPAIGLMHDRRWHITAHRRDALVLRMMENGEMIGQCNVTTLSNSEEDMAVDFTRFRQQIEELMGKQNGKIDEAAAAQPDEKIHVLRIAASASVKEVPVRWLYYYLAGPDGERAVLVFTLEEKTAKAFGESDHELVGGFRFLTPPAKNARAEDAEGRSR
jgi:hypothetical protein